MDPTIPVLMYHKIESAPRAATLKAHYVSVPAFQRQIRLLKTLGFHSILAGDIFQPPFPRRPIVLTFDDGYADFFHNALPALSAAGFNATVFLVVNQIGGTNRWDVAEGDFERPLMTLDQIQAASKAGTEFGSHTLDHVNLPKVSQADAWAQIERSKAVLEAKFGKPVRSFCYPYGAKTEEIREMVCRAGYKVACSTEKGVQTCATDPFAVPRINVRRDTTISVFAMKLVRGLKFGK